jgi:glycosyltransferase involved in cell wall biosynthesis
MPVTPLGNAPATPPDSEVAIHAGRRPVVALVGPRTDSRGGVGVTLRLLENSCLADEFDLVLVSTYRDGASARKAIEAASGLARLARLCATGQVDLVHVHASARGSLARKLLGIAIARAAGIPVVLHVHSGSLFDADYKRTQLLARLQHRAFRWALESSDAVVALTESWQQRLVSRGRVRRSSVIPNAPELTRLAERTNAGPECFVLFLGHLYRDKGVHELLEAFAVLKPARAELRLVMAGEGSEADELKLQTRRLGLDAAVEFPGWVGPDEKADLLARAACFVLPSYREGFPLSLLEAMVAGVPIVATAVGGVPDVVLHEQHALLVPPCDVAELAFALGRMLDDANLAARLGSAAQQRALVKYTPEALAKRVGELYREVLQAQ